MNIWSLIAYCSVYADGVWPRNGDLLEISSVGLNKHAPPATLLLVQSGVAMQGAVKCAKLQERAIVKVVGIPGLCGDVLARRLGCRVCLAASRSSKITFQS